MHVELITVGDELCRGEVVDTNSAWLAAELWEMQITVRHVVTCGDLVMDMKAAIQLAAQRGDVVIICGGLGLTVDDVTVDVVCELALLSPVVHAGAIARMQAISAAKGVPMAANQTRQARYPQGARTYENLVGIAPGFEILLGKSAVICLPGPPREMKSIFSDHVKTRIADIRANRGECVEHISKKTFRVFGAGESSVSMALDGLRMVDGANLHYQVSFPELLVKLVIRGSDASWADQELSRLTAAVYERLGPLVYGEGTDSLATALGGELMKKEYTVATAESCTGGMVASLLTDCSGSSAYFLGGVVAYSNREKIRQLGLSEDMIKRFGVVSETVAKTMARRVRERVGSSIGVSVTGIAGPNGGTEKTPVGTVCIGICTASGHVSAETFVWTGTRERIRMIAAYTALNTVRLHLASGV